MNIADSIQYNIPKFLMTENNSITETVSVSICLSVCLSYLADTRCSVENLIIHVKFCLQNTYIIFFNKGNFLYQDFSFYLT